MEKELIQAFKKSLFAVSDGRYVYTKVASPPKQKHFMVAQDQDEITVLAREENLKDLNIIEKNDKYWKLIALIVPPFTAGIIAAVTNAVVSAKKGTNTLIVSTFSKDYLIVREDSLELVKRTLVELGFTQKN